MPRNIKILDRQFVPKGTLVIEEGTLGNRAFRIERGRVQVFVKDAKGNEVIVAELGPESIIGEMAVITGSRRSASVRAIEDTILVTILAHELNESMRTSVSTFSVLMRTALERMRDTRIKLMKKERKLAALEKAALLTIENITQHIAKAAKFRLRQDTSELDRKLVPAGMMVIEQGAAGTDAFLIESGMVEVFIKDAAGNEVSIKKLGPKALIGEMAAIANEPRSASVRALEDTVLITVSAGDLKGAMGSSGSLHKRLMRMVVERMKDSHRKLFGKEPEKSALEKFDND